MITDLDYVFFTVGPVEGVLLRAEAALQPRRCRVAHRVLTRQTGPAQGGGNGGGRCGGKHVS